MCSMRIPSNVEIHGLKPIPCSNEVGVHDLGFAHIFSPIFCIVMIWPPMDIKKTKEEPPGGSSLC